MVDLLVRGGFLNEAKELVDLMPVEPDASIWRALLNERLQKSIPLPPIDGGSSFSLLFLLSHAKTGASYL
ncbi:hypothetical protein LINGRAHAP2_LOCUS18193 [Linum grandiflorum]